VQLSIIIVNYNVKYFLEYCIRSVLQCSIANECELIVVDNASSDGSVAHIESLFPSVRIISNQVNVGFAKANNQGMAIAKGKYLIYLNPDTLVSENSFAQCIKYFETHPKAGALGVYMLDGSGAYLPESKRGFPDLPTAFYKITGISRMLPKSAKYNKYYLGHLNKEQTHKVDVLAGCFIMMPTALAQQIGGFDEDYFMYGEDIDLSYRVQKAGYENVYLSETKIIHFKGESTRKASFNYLRMFYQAMIIFATKNLTKSKQRLFIPFIKLAIVLRASLGAFGTVVKKIWMPLLDALLMLLALWQTKNVWATYVKKEANYHINTLLIFFSTYILIWLCSITITGAYDKPIKAVKVFRGMLIGALITLAIYGLVPEAYRFSRAITLLGAAAGTLLIFGWRYLLRLIGVKDFLSKANGNKILIAANENNYSAIKNILQSIGLEKDIIGNVSTTASKNSIGEFHELPQLAKLHQVREIIFAQPDCTYTEMIAQMNTIGNSYDYKIFHEGSTIIVGSSSKLTQGELYASSFYFQINTPQGIRDKKVFDLISATCLLLFSPIFFLFVKKKSAFSKAFQVLFANKTWIGYANHENNLPLLRPSIYSIHAHDVLNESSRQLVNRNYARNYTWQMDLRFLWEAIR
jgi:O-antigen biosynthesis protein